MVSTKSRATLRYTTMRLSIFVLCFLVVWLLAYFRVLPFGGASGAILIFAVAAIISAPLSYVLLSKQRDEMSEELAPKVRRIQGKFAREAADEDEVDDRARQRGEAGAASTGATTGTGTDSGAAPASQEAESTENRAKAKPQS